MTPAMAMENCNRPISSSERLTTRGFAGLTHEQTSAPLLLPVITHLIGDRINVNATLVFSPRVHEQVFDDYLRGLERLMQQGEAVSEVVCFTSVAIGRLDAVMAPLIAHSELSFGTMQARLLYQHYRQLGQSERWRSLPEGVKPLRLVWDCTEMLPALAWCYLQILVVPETVMLLSPATLATYREVSLVPTSLIDDEQVEQILPNGLQMNAALDEWVDQLVNEERTRSLHAFERLLEAIAQKRSR